MSNCSRKNSRDSIWAAYHKQLVTHLSTAGVPSSVMATMYRRLMERAIAVQAAGSRTTNTEVVCITDEDKDIVEYIAGFAAHRIRQLMLTYCKFLMHKNLMFRQSTNNNITRQIDLPNLVQTAVNDASLLTVYHGCVNDVSATTLRKNDMFQELTFIYFMVRVNGFCRQTMEQFRLRHKMCRRTKVLTQ